MWKPDLCIHSGVCARGLPAVFNPRRRPWIDASAATTAEIIAQVGRCPSGALSLAATAASQPATDQEPTQ